jgi:hypothetical protein
MVSTPLRTFVFNARLGKPEPRFRFSPSAGIANKSRVNCHSRRHVPKKAISAHDSK